MVYKKFPSLHHFVIDRTLEALYINGYKQGIVTTFKKGLYSGIYINDTIYTICLYKNDKRVNSAYTINRHYKYNQKHLEQTPYINGKANGYAFKKVNNYITYKSYKDDQLYGKFYTMDRNKLLYYKYIIHKDYDHGLVFRVHADKSPAHKFYEYFRYKKGKLHGRQTRIFPQRRKKMVSYYKTGCLVSQDEYPCGVFV